VGALSDSARRLGAFTRRVRRANPNRQDFSASGCVFRLDAVRNAHYIGFCQTEGSMAKPVSPTQYVIQYVLNEMSQERFPQIWIDRGLAGDCFWLTDKDGTFFRGHSYKTRGQAEVARTKILEKAAKKFFKSAT
jgi:hypothetical protein